MSDREAMLERIRRQQVPNAPLPDFRFESTVPDPAGKFAESLAGVGGTCIRARDRSALNAMLEQLDLYRNASTILSRIPDIPGNLDASQISDPHQLSDLDVAILPGVLGVAENGAVWLDMHSLGPQRAAFVIAQHLVLVLDCNDIVATMHDACARTDLNEHGFGVFISGPSKTADIEQSLVIGAHGARSCTVFLVG